MIINTKRISSHNITELKPNEVFVFGSNEAGFHGAGAARQAMRWGAEYGQGVGMYGQTYALPTKSKRVMTLNLQKIGGYVKDFINFAKKHHGLKFLVTEVGCGLAGYTAYDIAPLFKEAVGVDNIFLPRSFWDILDKIAERS